MLEVTADILVPGVVMGDVEMTFVLLLLAGGERDDVDVARLRFQRVASNKSAEGCETCSGCDRRRCSVVDRRRVVDDLLRDMFSAALRLGCNVETTLTRRGREMVEARQIKDGLWLRA